MRNPAVSILLGVFLLAAVSLIFIEKKANNSLDRDLKIARVNADSIAKLNVSLDEDFRKAKTRNDSLAIKNNDLEKSLAHANSNLAVKNGEIRRIKSTTDETNKKYSDLLASQKDFDEQIATLKKLNDQLSQENKKLMSRAAVLSDENIKLNDRLLFATASSKDNILIETMNNRGKLNLKGKRVRKIVATLNTQSEMKNPTFRIFDPNGVQLSDLSGSFNLKKINESTSNSPGNSTKLELTYLLSKKIGPGLYKIEILNENKHMGNLLIRFR